MGTAVVKCSLFSWILQCAINYCTALFFDKIDGGFCSLSLGEVQQNSPSLPIDLRGDCQKSECLLCFDQNGLVGLLTTVRHLER